MPSWWQRRLFVGVTWPFPYNKSLRQRSKESGDLFELKYFGKPKHIEDRLTPSAEVLMSNCAAIRASESSIEQGLGKTCLLCLSAWAVCSYRLRVHRQLAFLRLHHQPTTTDFFTLTLHLMSQSTSHLLLRKRRGYHGLNQVDRRTAWPNFR